MKSGKTIATAKRALEILNNLMHKKMSVNEILDSLDFDKDYEFFGKLYQYNTKQGI